MESTTHTTSEDFSGEVTFTFPSAVLIPSGETMYFVLQGDVTVSDDTRSVRVTLEDEQGTGITFSQPIGLNNSDGLIDNDIEVLHTD